MPLYDYIYVDLDKVISVYSQMTGGIVEVLERSAEHSRSADNKRNYDFKVFKHDAGGTQFDTSSSRETIKPHHALLNEMEEALATAGYLIRSDRFTYRQVFSRSRVPRPVEKTFCIKVRGRTIIEDYERMKAIAGAFPEVVKLIDRSAESTLLASPAYLQLKKQLDTSEKALRAIKDRNARAAEEQRFKGIKESLSTLLVAATKINVVDQWLLDGMKTWIDAFFARKEKESGVLKDGHRSELANVAGWRPPKCLLPWRTNIYTVWR